MDKTTYLLNKARLKAEAEKIPSQCARCLRPQTRCYCPSVKRFNPNIKFVILTHPIEFRRRIATGRMASLCLENSEFYVGVNFANRPEISVLLAAGKYECCVLYPGINSTNLTTLAPSEIADRFKGSKPLCVFVIDGTWHTSKRMIRESPELNGLPRICFTPDTPSQFRVRKQPAEFCLSTIEAIHKTIGLLSVNKGNEHDALLEVFQEMVEGQLSYIQQSYANGWRSRHHLQREREALRRSQSSQLE